MAKLEYDNIFESIAKNKKEAAEMETASTVLMDLDDTLTVFGWRKDERNMLIKAVRRLHFARYH